MSYTPNAFVWEIGHESVFIGASAFCVADEAGCDSYDATAWAGSPSPTARKPSNLPRSAIWAERWKSLPTCSVYGGAFCIYPWYTLETSGYHFGVDYPDTLKDFGQANQFQQTELCGGGFGTDSTYCDTLLK